MLNEYEHRFLSSEVPPVPADQARFHVIPVPYEATVSYAGGTAQGPEAILEASNQLELFDGTSFPGTHGIFTHEPVNCEGSPEEVMERIRQAVLASLQCGAMPVVLGGEHSLTYGALAACKERFGRFGVIQFDAHADLRDSYEGSKWSHASAMRRAVSDLDLPLVQIGNRIFCKEELEARKKHQVVSWDAPLLYRRGIPENLIPSDFPRNVFITFDVDGLDPSIMPDTGTPVPGGLSWYQALDLASKAVEGRKMIGFDIVELAPKAGNIVSDFTAASLTYALMGLAERSGSIG